MTTQYDNSNFENWALSTRSLHVGQDLDGCGLSSLAGGKHYGGDAAFESC